MHWEIIKDSGPSVVGGAGKESVAIKGQFEIAILFFHRRLLLFSLPFAHLKNKGIRRWRVKYQLVHSIGRAAHRIEVHGTAKVLKSSNL